MLAKHCRSTATQKLGNAKLCEALLNLSELYLRNLVKPWETVFETQEFLLNHTCTRKFLPKFMYFALAKTMLKFSSETMIYKTLIGKCCERCTYCPPNLPRASSSSRLIGVHATESRMSASSCAAPSSVPACCKPLGFHLSSRTACIPPTNETLCQLHSWL